MLDVINIYFVILHLFYRVTCSLITSDLKYVAAGSLDSLVYLWERSYIPTKLNVNNTKLDNTIGQSSFCIPNEQKEKFIEM